MTIDPVTLARFMVLPGAAELVDAYSRIPPGALRQSVISHAQVIAGTYDEAISHGAPIPDPLMVAAQGVMTALPSAPTRTGGIAASPEMQTVDLRMAGRKPKAIAADLGLPMEDVRRTLKAARGQGIEFPATGPTAPNAHRAKLVHLPSTVAELTQKQLAGLSLGAKRHGLDLATYLERRRLAVDMAMAGPTTQAAIAEAIGEDVKYIAIWLALARKAGIDVPPVPLGHTKPRPRAKHPRSPKRFWLTPEEISNDDMRMARQSAANLHTDIAGLGDLRRKALEMFREERTPATVAATLGLTPRQALVWRALARSAGLLPST